VLLLQHCYQHITLWSNQTVAHGSRPGGSHAVGLTSLLAYCQCQFSSTPRVHGHLTSECSIPLRAVAARSVMRPHLWLLRLGVLNKLGLLAVATARGSGTQPDNASSDGEGQ
jgi:hypothetical protein